MTTSNDERNARRRALYAEKKNRTDAATAGANALRNVRELRLDGFYSQTTGAGISGVDKMTSYSFAEGEELDEATLCALYLDNDIAATIVERQVLDALRGGYDLNWLGASDAQAKDLREWAEAKLDVTTVVKRARIYSRLFGGGAVLLGQSGTAFDKAPAEGSPIEFLRPVASKDLAARAWYADPSKQRFSTVAIYDYAMPTFAATVGTGQARTSVDVHEERAVEMYGILTTDDRFRETGWGDSVLRRVYEVIKQFEAAYQSVLHTLAENSIPVYKVTKLLEMLASENADLLQARFQLLNAGKSNYRAIVLDENETFERVEAGLAEAANVVESAMMRVSGAAGIPATVLWGRSPAGMNATGTSDLEIWNQQVVKEQSLVLGPVIETLYRTIILDPESPVFGEDIENLTVNFGSLWTPSLQDEVNNYAQVAGADVAYINSGTVSAEQVALKRASEGGLFPRVNVEVLQTLEDIRSEDVVEKAINPPPAPDFTPKDPEADPSEEPKEGEEEEAGDE